MLRRDFLMRAGLLGCSVAASPLMTPITLASAPWDHRLVVIILRGGMDGMDVVQPYGDPNLKVLRPNFKIGEAGGGRDLDGYFSLHPALNPIYPMWKAGDLAFANAVATPYRNKRSHFDGQDILEAGSNFDENGLPRDGWLNRLLQVSPGVESETAFAIGQGEMQILRGPAQASNWSPKTMLQMSGQAERLLELIYHDDPLFRDAAQSALGVLDDLEATPMDENSQDMAEMGEMMASSNNKGMAQIAEFAVGRLLQDTRIASFSIGGWDTHGNQKKALPKRLRNLSSVLNILKAGLGPVWEKTTVVAMTEFGRTARSNGTGGTDHGTGGSMIMAGGAVRGGRIYGDWPGLEEADLFMQRDLMPTRDVRAYAGWALRGMFGTASADIERLIFPGVEMGSDPGFIL